MRKTISLLCLISLCLLSATAAPKAEPKYSGEIKAEYHNPGYDKSKVDSLAGTMLVCKFETGDIEAYHTVELSIRGKKADGKYTKWKRAAYNPDVNYYDYPELPIVSQAVDLNILKAVGGYQAYDRNRYKKFPEKTVAIPLPSFDDETEQIVQYEIDLKYTNNCLRSGRCLWSIK